MSNSKQARLRLFRFHQLGLHQLLELRDGDGVVLLELHFRDLALVEGRRVAALRLVVVVLESGCHVIRCEEKVTFFPCNQIAAMQPMSHFEQSQGQAILFRLVICCEVSRCNPSLPCSASQLLFSVSESQLNVVLVLEKLFQVVVKPELEKTIVGQNLLLFDEHLRNQLI